MRPSEGTPALVFFRPGVKGYIELVAVSDDKGNLVKPINQKQAVELMAHLASLIAETFR